MLEKAFVAFLVLGPPFLCVVMLLFALRRAFWPRPKVRGLWPFRNRPVGIVVALLTVWASSVISLVVVVFFGDCEACSDCPVLGAAGFFAFMLMVTFVHGGGLLGSGVVIGILAALEGLTRWRDRVRSGPC
jgi:hypothetical protein